LAKWTIARPAWFGCSGRRDTACLGLRRIRDRNTSDHYEIRAVSPHEYYTVALSTANLSPFSDGILDETLIALATSVTVRAGETALADLHLIARRCLTSSARA
jgi:hypothetical protein